MRLLGAVTLLLLLCLARHYQLAEAGGAFVKTSGHNFVINGNPFYANGFNAYWFMIMATNLAQRNKVSSVLNDASSHGLSVARTWAFSDGGGTPLQSSPGFYSENTFQALDFVVSEARKYGIRLILSLANNYNVFGGKGQYVNWARSQGQNIASDDGFFTNALVKQYYKKHVMRVLTRVNTITGVAYKDDSTIMAWELMNEARCQSDPSGKTLQAWITEMAAYVKSIDSKHLLEIGLEGFYGPSTPSRSQINPAGHQVGSDFISNNKISNIDFATIHSYPDQWLPQSTDHQAQMTFLNSWLNAHVEDAQSVLGKPLLLAEFGQSSKDNGFTDGERDGLYGLVFSKIYASAQSGGAMAGGLFWQLFADGMGQYSDGYEVVFDQRPSTANVIAVQSRRLHFLGKTLSKGKIKGTGN